MLPLVMFTGEIADSKVVLHKEEEEEGKIGTWTVELVEVGIWWRLQLYSNFRMLVVWVDYTVSVVYHEELLTFFIM